MNKSFIPHSLQSQAVTLNTATKIMDVPTGVVRVSFPVTTNTWVHIRPTQLADPTLTDIQNYGILYDTTDGFVELEVGQTSEIWLATSTTTTIYATLWTGV